MASTKPARPLPALLQVAASVVAVGHLLVIGLYALAASSGPWPLPPGLNLGGQTASEAIGPQFARSIVENVTFPYYLKPLRMTHNYHFASNRPAEFAVYFEVRLKNDMGDVRTVTFPDEKANRWVRHRQEVLAQNLVPDTLLPPRGGERVAAKELPKVEIWVSDGPQSQSQRLKMVDENDDRLRNPQIDQPTPYSKALVQSYVRYLCREHKATSAELIRHSRRTVVPSDLYVPRPAELFKELVSHFGEYRP